MKRFNHKKVLNIFYGQTVQTTVDPQDRMLDGNQLKTVIEILEDCNCSVCKELVKGFRMSIRFAEMKDIPAASIALTATCEKLGTLLIPQNFSLQ